MDLPLTEIELAAERIEDIADRTPLLQSYTFSRFFQAEIYLKCENLQRTGSFKLRGAANKLAKLVSAGSSAPVVAASAGNHAQGVAYAATRCGISSTIVMPCAAPLAKIAATSGYGATVVQHGTCFDETVAKAQEICAETGALFLHPYDDYDVIAGQATAGLELISQIPDPDIVLVPAGGGGLLAGVAAAVKQVNPKVRVIGVQAEGADAVARSFHAKKRVTTESAVTLADGIAVKTPGELTTPLILKYADEVITVSEESILAAITLLAERSKMVVEGAGAVPIAALLERKLDVAGKKVVCLLSGGNIDICTIQTVLQKGMIARHRWIELDIRYLESELSMSHILQIFADSGANLLSLTHNMMCHPADMNEQNLHVICEVRNIDHSNALIKMLRDQGCEVTDKIAELNLLLNDY